MSIESIRAELEAELQRKPLDVQAQARFREARDAAMRGERLVGEGDVAGGYAAITAAIGALERANDALEALEQEAAMQT